ncbi:MAG: MlaD family protein [Burkholderiaceae bacterium]|jgi:phospholipid/cholesterol/gamma-HCH transport system substrate-binding protein
MEDRSHALIAGLFTVALGIALGFAALWFSRDRTQRVEYELVTHGSVSGLAEESPVRFKGVDVGSVASIRFDPDQAGQILIRVTVDKDAPVTESTHGELAYQGVTGLSFIQLSDDGSKPTRLATSPDHIARLQIEPGLLDRLSGNSQQLIDGLGETLRRLNALLGDENQKMLTKTLAGLNEAALSTTALEHQLGPSLSRLPGTIDESKRALSAVAEAAKSYEELAVRLQEKDGTLARLSDSLDQFDAAVTLFSVRTLPRFNALTDEAGHTARSVTHAVDRLDEQPQSLLFGRARPSPGPGEPGFEYPR